MKIEILYPEIANLYGDLASPRYLARSCDATLVYTTLNDTPAFIHDDIALVYLGSTTEKGQLLVKNALAHFVDALHARTERGGVTLVTGNALEIFNEYIEDENGIKHDMFAWFPNYAIRDMMYHYDHVKRKMVYRHNSFYLGEFEDIKIVGFKSQFSHTYGANHHPLFKTLNGVGINPDDAFEGFKRNNFIATYLLGPFIILNPLFAKYILKLMGISEPHLAFEEAIMDAYNVRLAEFIAKGKNLNQNKVSFWKKFIQFLS